MEVNFERNPEFREAFAFRDPALILSTLTLLTGQTIVAGMSLLFLDEIQAGTTGSLKSLHQFLKEKQRDFALRFNADTPSLLRDSKRLPDGTGIDYDLLSLPLYMVGQARRLAGDFEVKRGRGGPGDRL